MEFGVDIKSLTNNGLEEYRDYLFEKLIGVVQSENRRITLLDRIDRVREEIDARQTEETGPVDQLSADHEYTSTESGSVEENRRQSVGYKMAR